MTFRIEIIDMKTRHSGLAGGGYFGPKCCVTFIPKALNETNFQTKTKTIKLHLLDMNPYLARHVGIVDAPSDIWHEAHVHHPVGFVQQEAFTGWNPIFFC